MIADTLHKLAQFAAIATLTTAAVACWCGAAWWFAAACFGGGATVAVYVAAFLAMIFEP